MTTRLTLIALALGVFGCSEAEPDSLLLLTDKGWVEVERDAEWSIDTIDAIDAVNDIGEAEISTMPMPPTFQVQIVPHWEWTGPGDMEIEVNTEQKRVEIRATEPGWTCESKVPR